jgi:hypothetical protein
MSDSIYLINFEITPQYGQYKYKDGMFDRITLLGLRTNKESVEKFCQIFVERD